MNNSFNELGIKLVSGVVVGLNLLLVQPPEYFSDAQYQSLQTKKEVVETTDKGEEITAYGKIKYKKILNDFWATSYDSSCEGCSNTTATGMKQGYGVVAVDPKVIPLYSKVYVPGYGVGIAGDVGGAVKGDKIDLGFDKLEGQWSARYVDVYILDI